MYASTIAKYDPTKIQFDKETMSMRFFNMAKLHLLDAFPSLENVCISSVEINALFEGNLQRGAMEGRPCAHWNGSWQLDN